VVGKEGRMIWESVILVVVGWALSEMGSFIRGRRRQEERKSERRRELYEKELGPVSAFVDAVVEGMAQMDLSRFGESRDWRHRFGLMTKPYELRASATIAAGSVGDEKLAERIEEFGEVVGAWIGAFDLRSGKAKEGKEKELEELRAQMELVASQVKRRMRELLMEV